jgi:hypothetical protein
LLFATFFLLLLLLFFALFKKKKKKQTQMDRAENRAEKAMETPPSSYPYLRLPDTKSMLRCELSDESKNYPNVDENSRAILTAINTSNCVLLEKTIELDTVNEWRVPHIADILCVGLGLGSGVGEGGGGGGAGGAGVNGEGQKEIKLLVSWCRHPNGSGNEPFENTLAVSLTAGGAFLELPMVLIQYSTMYFRLAPSTTATTTDGREKSELQTETAQLVLRWIHLCSEERQWILSNGTAGLQILQDPNLYVVRGSLLTTPSLPSSF